MSANFSLYGRKIEFNNSQVEYNKWRLYYDDLAAKCADKYISELYEKYDGLDGFSKHGFEGGWKIIGEALNKTIQVFVDAKRYDIDENSFLDQYGEYCFSDWVEVYNEINDKYMEIVLKAEEMDEYRAQRRQGRARIIGGGFGLQGAVKGMVTAGAANMAWGAVHGAFNLVGKGISMIGDSFKKSSIYKSEETKNTLRNGIYCSIFNIHYALCDIFKIPVIADNHIKTADTLFNNIGKMKPEDILENVVKILSLNPYKCGAYEYCIEVYGDKQNEVQKMSSFFGLNVEHFKNRLLEAMHGKLDLSNEQSTLASKATLQDSMVNYGLRTSDLLKEIDKKLEFFDKQARTVDGELFSSREEARKAAQELETVKKIVGNDYVKNEAQALAALDKLRHTTFSSSMGQKYIERVEKVVAEFDQVARTYGDKIFDTREEAGLAKHEDEELQKIMKASKTTDLQGVQNALEAINKAGFKTTVQKKYVQQLESSSQEYLGKIKEYEEQYGNKSGWGKFFQVILEIIVCGGLIIFLLPRWGWIGMSLATLVFIGMIGMWMDRRKAKKMVKAMKQQEEKGTREQGLNT